MVTAARCVVMIPGRTKGSLARFFRDQGAWWCRQVEVVVSDGSRTYRASIAQYLPDVRHVLDRFHVARWFTQGLTLVRRELQRRPPTFEPDLFRARFTLLRRVDHLTDAHQKHLSRLFDAHPRLRTAWERSKSSTSCIRPTTGSRQTRRLDGSRTYTPAARHREYREIVDTIIAWGAQILAYHSCRRVSNGPLEGINNPHPGSTPRLLTALPTMTITQPAGFS